ncbi:MAG: hypothetical protein QXE23_06090 [Nitrososphaerota archaeon]
MGIGKIKVTKFREGGQVREVEIVVRRGTVRIVEGGQEMRAKIKRVWREGEVDEKQRSYERILTELVPVTEAVEVREG